MPRGLQTVLILILFLPVVVTAGLLLCETVSATKGWVAALISEKVVWGVGTIFCLACLTLLYDDGAPSR